jgi:hypothetical protein
MGGNFGQPEGVDAALTAQLRLSHVRNLSNLFTYLERGIPFHL